MALNAISAYIPDYLAASLQEKLALLHTLKLSHLELSHREAALGSLPASEVYDIRDLLIDEGCSVSLYETSVNPADKTSLNALLRNAHLLGIPSSKWTLPTVQTMTLHTVWMLLKAMASLLL